MFCDGARFEASKQIISKVMLMQCWDSVAQNSLCFIADNLNTSSESVSEVASNILLRGGGGPPPPVYTRWGRIVITRTDHSSLPPSDPSQTTRRRSPSWGRAWCPSRRGNFLSGKDPADFWRSRTCWRQSTVWRIQRRLQIFISNFETSR